MLAIVTLSRTVPPSKPTALADMTGRDQPNGPWVSATQPLGDVLAPAARSLLNSRVNSYRTTFILGDPTFRFAVVKPPGTPIPTLSIQI